MTASSMTGEVTVGTVPLAPTNLTTTILTGPQIRLTWRDNATNETGFVIERSTDNSTWTRIGTAPARNSTGNQTFTDTTITPPTADITYYYRVAAQNPVGLSAYSNTASRLLTVAAAPIAPTTLTAALTNGPQVVLTWRDNATTESGFVIQRSTNGGAFTQIATAPALATTGTVTFTDTTVTTSFADVTYTYQVAATNSTGISSFSTPASVLMPAKPIAPGSFTIVNGPNSNKTWSVILTWLDNSSNETGFTIERATNSTFTLGLTSVTVPAGTTTYTVTGLSRSTQYWFRIRSNNGAYVFSSWVNAAPFPITTNP